MFVESSNYSILVCDEDELFSTQLCQLLQKRGYLTQLSSSLDQARHTLSNIPVNLLLLGGSFDDEIMLSLARESAIPCIFMGEQESLDFFEDFFACGLVDYVPKPVNVSLLLVKIDSLLQSASIKQLLREQKKSLERFKREAEREEAMAKFTYEYLLGQKNAWRPGLEIWAQPSASFSGDVALVRESPAGDCYFLLADATGHGLSAAITIMPLVSIFNSMVDKGFELPAIVAEMNRKLAQAVPDDRFVAAILVQCQWSRHEMHRWNGAMPTAYWYDAGRVVAQFPPQHMALGILDDDSFNAHCQHCRLPATGNMLVYTDGLIDARNPNGQAFSQARVAALIADNPPALLPAILQSLHEHRGGSDFDDDISICLLTPALIRAGSQDALVSSERERRHNFSWQVTLSGQQLAKYDLALLCNQLLQFLELEKPLLQRTFSLLSEMLAYALDGRILQLDPALRQRADGIAYYLEQRRQRLTQLSDSDTLCLSVNYVSQARELLLVLEGSGSAYPSEHSRDVLEQLAVVKHLAKHLNVHPDGHRVQVSVPME